MSEHRIRWYARFPYFPEQDWTPRTKRMRGTWAWDVKCSCGQETRTGGATERHIRDLVWAHKELGEDL